MLLIKNIFVHFLYVLFCVLDVLWLSVVKTRTEEIFKSFHQFRLLGVGVGYGGGEIMDPYAAISTRLSSAFMFY